MMLPFAREWARASTKVEAVTVVNCRAFAAASADGVMLKRTKIKYNFANSTFDQVNRLLKL